MIQNSKHLTPHISMENQTHDFEDDLVKSGISFFEFWPEVMEKKFSESLELEGRPTAPFSRTRAFGEHRSIARHGTEIPTMAIFMVDFQKIQKRRHDIIIPTRRFQDEGVRAHWMFKVYSKAVSEKKRLASLFFILLLLISVL